MAQLNAIERLSKMQLGGNVSKDFTHGYDALNLLIMASYLKRNQHDLGVQCSLKTGYQNDSLQTLCFYYPPKYTYYMFMFISD